MRDDMGISDDLEAGRLNYVAFKPIKEPSIEVIHAGGNDVDRAQDYKSRLMGLLTEVATVMSEAKSNGMTVQFSMSPPDAFGRFSVTMLEISKKLA